MDQLLLRPDLKTAGGEVSDILLNDRFVGTLMIVYREGERAAGSAQLDASVLSEEDKQEVLYFLKDYVHAFGNAICANYSDVLVTYSDYDQIFSFGDEEDARLHTLSESSERTYAYDDEGDSEEWEYELEGDEEPDVSYELVVIDEEEESAEYQIYDDSGECVAHASLSIQLGHVHGEIVWLLEPEEDAITLITDILMKEFDEDAVGSFLLEHVHDGVLIETAEYESDDEEDDDEESWQDQDPYHVVLVRDDTDALTFEIFSPFDSSLPIAHATIDTQQRRLSGFIDFRERDLIDDAAEIAVYLMRELDKERDYDGLSLSLMYRNELVDELVIENEYS